MNKREELLVITKMYDYIKWVSPILNRLPRDRKFTIGDRFFSRIYEALENMIKAKYRKNEKIKLLEDINVNLEIIRFYQRLLNDENLWNDKKYAYASSLVNEIGKLLGSWLKQVKGREL